MDMMHPCVIAIALFLIGCDELPSEEGTLVDVGMPDGTVIKGVPEGTTQSELLKRLENGGYATEAMLGGSRDAQVTYQIIGKNGTTYRVHGPTGLTRAQIIADVLRKFPEAGIEILQERGVAVDNYYEYQREEYRGEIVLNYGSSRYGDPLYRYRGEVDESGYVRLRNPNGDTLRGHVDSDGSVRLRNFDGDVYRGRIDEGGSIRLKDYDGSTLSGQLDSDF